MVRYDKFYWGIAQDDRMQAVGQYTYSNNINIRKGKWIELENAAEVVWASALFSAGIWITSCFVKSTSVWYAGTNNGYIMYTSNGGSTFTTLLNTWFATPIIDIVELKDNLYFFSELKSFVRTTYTDLAAWVMWGNVTTLATLTTTSDRQSVVVGNNIIFYIEGKSVNKCTSLTPTATAVYGSTFSVPFSVQNKVVWLTMHWNTLWLYEESGKMYCLDNTSEETIGFKDFKETIVAVRNLWGYDVVVTKSVYNDYVRSWVMNTGVSPESSQLIRRYRYSDTVRQSSPSALWGHRFWFDKKGATDFTFADSEWLLYWCAKDQWTPLIYSFWKTDNVLPESASIVSTFGVTNALWDDIKAIWIANGYMMISQVTSNLNYVRKIKLFDTSTTVYPSSGYLITKVDDFWLYEVPKTISQVMLWADIPTWTSVKLEYSINEGEFVEYRTITNLDAIWTNGKKFEFSEPIEMFNEISWRIALITANSGLTPKIYSFTHQINQIIYEETK